MYAGRKRRKPVQRAVKQPPPEVTKSNPSKRHRDRLNGELERLASLLPFPEEVTSSLDKLSILRLSVSYLRAKNFFTVALKSHHACNGVASICSNEDNDKASASADSWLPEGELLLQALNGFVMVITADGTIFYCSHTIQDYLGFHQTDVMHQSVYELVHTEDQQELRRNLHWALNPPPATLAALAQESPQEMEVDPSSTSIVTYNPEQLPPENSSFLERSFVCRFRCLLDNSSGFLALTLQGRLKFLHGQNQRHDNGGKAPPQLALFTIATPLQPPSILEIRTKNMIFRTKHKLDFTPMACDAKGKIVLGYTEAELRVRGSGYQFIHAADMLYCAENHVRMMKTGESGLTVFRLLTKDNRWKWVQANARLVYKNGKPDYIIATQRPLVEEEGGEHLRKRSMHLPFTYATGEALLYQSNHPIAGFIDGGHEKNGSGKSKKSRTGERAARDAGVDPGSLLGALMSQDESVYVCQPALEPKLAFHGSFFGDQMMGGVSEPSEPSSSLQHHRSWEEASALASGGGVLAAPGRGLPASAASFDPLLATLDSLSLGGHQGGDVAEDEDGGCSNGELFGALEGLGLSAEDLELLLLDERMIRVEMDPDRVPTLDDLLTNDEILNYIHDSLEAKADGNREQAVVASPPASANRAAVPAPSATVSTPPESGLTAGANVHAAHYPHHHRPPPLPLGHAPIVQLSQQMQQHLNMQPSSGGKGMRRDFAVQNNSHMAPHPAPPVLNHHHHGLLGPNNQPIPDEPAWTARDILATAGVQGVQDHCHTTHQQTVFSSSSSKAPGLQDGMVHLHYLQQQQQQQSSMQSHLLQQQQQQRHAKQKGTSNLNGLCNLPHAEAHAGGKLQPPQWPGNSYGFSHPGESSNDCLSNGQASLAHSSLDACMDYGMLDIDGMDFNINGGGGGGGGGQLHRADPGGCSSSYQRMNHVKRQPEPPLPAPLAQVLSSLSQCPPLASNATAVTLEHILAVGQPCRQLDAYGMVASDIPHHHDPNHSKMENGCVLSSPFPGGCALPNGNGAAAPPNGQMLPGAETLPGLPDPQATGFYL